jgi:hypothetical protein
MWRVTYTLRVHEHRLMANSSLCDWHASCLEESGNVSKVKIMPVC